MDLPHPVPNGRLIPAVQGKLPNGVHARGANHQPPLPQQLRRHPNPGQHIVFRLHHPPPLPPEHLKEAGGGGVHHHGLNPPPPGQPSQLLGVLPVGFLPHLLSGVVIILLHPVPDAVPLPPQPEGGGIHRPVIAGNTPPLQLPLRRRFHVALIEEVVHSPLRSHPLSQHESPVKIPAEHPAIAPYHLRRQSRIVLHQKVQIQRPPLPGPLNPLPVKPVGGIFGVAVKPQLGPLHRAPRAGLLHKGAGHQRRLIQQHPGQSHPLNQGGAPLILAAEEIEGINPPPEPHRQQMLRTLFRAGKPQLPQHRHQPIQKVAPQSPHGFPAQPEPLPLKPPHGPAHKGQPHTDGLSAAHGAVADNGLQLPTGRPVTPPGQHDFLFFGKGLKPHDPLPPSAPGPGRRPLPVPARPPAPGRPAAPKPPAGPPA